MKVLLAAVGTTALLLSTGCAQSVPSAAASSHEAAITDIQTTVAGAAEAAKTYGTKHLGHYLELNAKALRAEGFAPAEGVTVTVFVDHFDICVAATSATLPAGSEWSTATATSAKPEATAGGRCSSTALKRIPLHG